MTRRFDRWLFVFLFALVASVTVARAEQGKAIPDEIKRAPAAATPANDGKVMFSTYCAVCHGLSGRGDGPAAPALKKNPADLTVLTRENGGKFPDARFRDVVASNALVLEHGSSDMPMWGPIFRQMPGGNATATLRVKNLLDYVISLQAR